MAQEGLLRHIFKRGLLSTKLKKAAHHTADDNDSFLSTQPSEHTNKAASSNSTKAYDVPGTDACSSCSSSNETLHTASIPLPTSQPASSSTTLSVRDVLHAVIEEAHAATAMHMETLETTLALLHAIQGMSATVDILQREMQEKKEVCEEMRRDLVSFEEVVGEMGVV